MIKLIGKMGAAQQAKGAEGRVDEPIKHISQLDPTARARADQSTRQALLAIVIGQGQAVSIPIDVLQASDETHRLLMESDGVTLTLTAEKADLVYKG